MLIALIQAITNRPPGQQAGKRIPYPLRSPDDTGKGMKYKQKIIKAGCRIEAYKLRSIDRPRSRRKKSQPTTEKQAARNRQKQRQKLTRLILANFGDADRFVTYTFDSAHEPDSTDKTRKAFHNYLRRLKRKYKAPLPYLYVIERGEFGRLHIHAIMPGDIPEDILFGCWTAGRITHAEQLDSPDTIENLVGYMLKGQSIQNGRRAWGGSKGLLQAEVAEKEISEGEYLQAPEQVLVYDGKSYTLDAAHTEKYFDAWSGQDICYAVYYLDGSRQRRHGAQERQSA